MAALQSIRNHPVVLSTILGGGLILMIIMFGFDDYNGFFQGDRDTVLDVDGNKISWANYETARQRKTDFFQSLYNQEVNKPEVSQQINQQTYNSLVSSTLLDKEMNKLGLGVSNAELSELVQGAHLSPVMTQIFGQSAQFVGQYFAQAANDDNFDEMAMQMQAPWFSKNNWEEILSNISDSRKQQKYAALLSAAIQPNKLEAEDLFNGENEEVAFNYVSANAFQVADSLVKVSNSDIKAYYDSHKDNFKLADKVREVAYIAVPLNPSEEDCSAVLANIQKANDQFLSDEVEELISANSTVPFIDAHLNNNIFRGELKEFVDNNEIGAVSEPAIYSGDILNLVGEQSGNNETLSQYYWTARILDKVNAPDSVKVILTAANEKADSILASIKKGEMDEQAQWLTEAAAIGMDNGLRNKLFAVPAKNASAANDIFTYTFNNGQMDVTVACKIVERTANVNKSKVAIYAEHISPSSKTRRTEYGKINEFINDCPTVAQMQDSALSRGFHVYPTTVSTTNYNIGQVQDSRNAVRFAFEGKKGDISEIYENGGYLLVVGITGDIQEGYSSLSDKSLSSFIERQLLAGKQVAYLIDNKFAAATDKSLEGYAQAVEGEVRNASRVSFNTTNISGLGIEPAVVGAALKAETGTVVGPIAGKNCAVVLQVTGKNNKGLTYDEASYLTKAQNSMAYRNAANLALSLLDRDAEITDNRIRFY